MSSRKSTRTSNRNQKPSSSRSTAVQGKRSAPPPRPRVKDGPRKAAIPSNRGRTVTFGSIGAVIVIVLVIVLVSVTSSTPQSGNGSSPAPASVTAALQTIPASVYDQVGVSSSSVPVSAPSLVSGQNALTFGDATKKKPGVFLLSGEFCPFCAAQRWGIAAALARFGSFSHLRVTSSSSTDTFPSTPTLSFYRSSFSSPYLTFQAVEEATNRLTANGQGYQPLENPTRAQIALTDKYDTTKFVSSLESSSENGSIPFLDVGNRLLAAGASYSPAILAGLSQRQIAQALHDPKSLVAQPIIATANYLTAGICASTGQQPGAVCNSKGVLSADRALGMNR